MTEHEMGGWHHHLSEHEFEQTPGDCEGQGSLVCCTPWGSKESYMTEQLNSNKSCKHLSKWQASGRGCVKFFLPSTGGQGSEQRHFNSKAEGHTCINTHMILSRFRKNG